MATPTDRKNQLVWDEINHGTYKQALQLCNRRIKKGDKSEYLLALKALVLTLIETPSTEVEAIELANTLSNQNPPTNNIEVLRLLTRVWSMLGPQYAPEATKLWERAVKTQPGNEALAKEWFSAAVRTMEWRGMQKAAMNLQKGFAKKREYWFWAVVCSLLLHNSLPEDSNERKLFGTLAYRMIDKARNETPEDTTVVPPRAIHTSQEVNLLLEMLPYVAPGDATEEALKVLNSPNLGVDSKIGAGDWWGLARLRLDLYEKSADWKALFGSCATLLAGVEKQSDENGNSGVQGRGDDWRVWDGYVKAAGKLHEVGETEKAKDALDAILRHSKDASSRNPHLALVKFASLFLEKNGPKGTPALLQTCEEYFGKIGAKSCCFEDLQVYLEMLKEEKEEFLKYVEKAVDEMSEEDEKSKIDKFACRINFQKFVYLLRISPMSAASSDSTTTITAFVVKSLDIYTSALDLASSRSLLTTDNQYGDDAALVAVMGLVRLYLLSPSDQAPLYQAAILLETLLTKSRHNYQALLLLIRLYLLLGAIPLAVELYPRLNIKQIQNDTLSHFLLTRIDTLLPKDNRVRVLLEEAGGIYNSSRTQTPNMLQLAFDRGGYAQMLGFLEFSQRVAGSVCRSMWNIELARIDRLEKTSPEDAQDLEEIGHEGKVWDNRDFAVVVSCEAKSLGRDFESLFRLGPVPGENWVKAFAKAEEIVRYCEFGSKPKQTNGAAPALHPSGGIIEDPAIAAKELEQLLQSHEEFTVPEKVYLEAVKDIGSVLGMAVHSKDSTSFAQGLEKFGEAYSSTPALAQNKPHNWHTLHELWMQNHLVFAASTLLHYAKNLKAKPAIPKNAVEVIEKGIKARREAVKTAKQIVLKEQATNDDFIQGLVDGVLNGGVGKVLQQTEKVFGGVEKVADAVRRVAGGFRAAVEVVEV